MNDADLRNRLIRLAHANPAVRKDVLCLLASEGPTTGKYEEGKPADPTENMSPEDKKTWELNTLKHKDDFKKEAWGRSRRTVLPPRVIHVTRGDTPVEYDVDGKSVRMVDINDALREAQLRKIRFSDNDGNYDAIPNSQLGVKPPVQVKEQVAQTVQISGEAFVDIDSWKVTGQPPRGYVGRVAANVSRLKRDIWLKSGEIVPQGSKATVEFDPDRASLAILKVEGRNEPVKVSTINLHEYFAGFGMPPSRATLAKWVHDGIAKSVAGQRVEPDGWDSKGTPSWLIVLGFI